MQDGPYILKVPVFTLNNYCSNNNNLLWEYHVNEWVRAKYIK